MGLKIGLIYHLYSLVSILTVLYDKITILFDVTEWRKVPLHLNKIPITFRYQLTFF